MDSKYTYLFGLGIWIEVEILLGFYPNFKWIKKCLVKNAKQKIAIPGVKYVLWYYPGIRCFVVLKI